MASILVVDDDPSVRALVRDVLELEGHVVELADDGYAALRAVAAERPDCVVLDVDDARDGRPRGAGPAAGEGRRPGPAGGHADRRADDANAWRGWAGGVDCLLAKPFDADELLRYLDRLFAAAADRPRC